jgi:hypothetical protein
VQVGQPAALLAQRGVGFAERRQRLVEHAVVEQQPAAHERGHRQARVGGHGGVGMRDGRLGVLARQGHTRRHLMRLRANAVAVVGDSLGQRHRFGGGVAGGIEAAGAHLRLGQRQRQRR